MKLKNKKPTDPLIIGFPLMRLKRVYTLSFGDIGPLNKLTKYSIPLNIQEYFVNRFLINDEIIKEPTLAISIQPELFQNELEIISFLYYSDWTNSDSSIFGKHFNTGSFTRRNLNSIFYTLELDDPFENRLKKIIKSNYYKSLATLLETNSTDIEFNKERERIIIAMRLFNEAQINIDIINPFSHAKIILISAAFEALLNLPQEAKTATFIHSITSLIGPKSSMLTDWCRDFYNYRSSLVHGDIAWRDDTKEQFKVSGKKGPAHRYIAHQVFIECLKVKLFLMGKNPKYVRAFNFETFINTWINNKNHDHHTFQSKII